MTAPYIPDNQTPTETEAEKWIRRIQAAHQHIITPGDPHAEEAKHDIEIMRGHLLNAIEQERAQNKITDASEMRSAHDMGPLATFGESAGKAASLGIGGMLQDMLGEGEDVNASESANPLSHYSGMALGTLATLYGPQKFLALARAGKLADATLEATLLRNATMREGLGDAGEGIAGPTKKATDPLTKRLMDMFGHGDEPMGGDTGGATAPKGPTPKPGEPTAGNTLNRAPKIDPGAGPKADFQKLDPYGLDNPPPGTPPESLAPHDRLDPWSNLGKPTMSPEEINKMLQDIMKPPKPPFLP